MNIINKLTIRHLKENKRRTIVTIIGVIISVAMVTAVSTLGVSFLDLMKRQTIADRGEWHVKYEDVNNSQLKAIEKNEQTESLILSRDRGYAFLEGSQNDYKPYLFIKEYNEQAFEHFPIKLSDGRLPQQDGEVVISEAIWKNAKVDLKIGETLTIEVGQRFLNEGQQELGQTDPLQKIDGNLTESLKTLETKTYKIVGTIERPTWEPTWAPGYTIINYLEEKTVGKANPADAIVIVKKVKKSLYQNADRVVSENQIQAVSFNNELLRYYGITNNSQLQATLFSLSAIIMTVIVIGSVALIYNAFAISVSERARHLGMLSSVGATKRQKRNSVFFEGAVIGLISIPIGLLSGLAGIGITFLFINSILQGALRLSEKLTLTVTPLSILSACGISIITIFISTYLPARKASKISAIDAIRQTQDIKLSGRAVKTSKLIRKVFGIEAEIGLKNLKRNKKRYRVTVFSLIISIVLFLAVSYFTENLKKALELSQDGINFDIQVSTNQGDLTNDQLLTSIAKLEEVTDFSLIKQFYVTSWVEEKYLSEDLKSIVIEDPNVLKDGKYQYNITVHGLDEKSFEQYAKTVGADIKELQNSEGLKAIVIDTYSYGDEQQEKYVEKKAIHAEPGLHLDLNYQNWETGEETFLQEVEVAAFSKELPMGMMSAGGLNGLAMIMSDKAMEKLISGNQDALGELQTFLYLKSKDPMSTQESIEEMDSSNLHIYNVYQARQQEEQLVLLMSVFTYGFIVLITAISIANIFNTISTSISLRKREFAMLKSVGMTPKGFNKMMNYESIFYGIKSLLYGLPISFAVMYLIYRALMNSFEYQFTLPWLSIVYVIAAIFVIVGSAMLYSIKKARKENIIDALKQENI